MNEKSNFTTYIDEIIQESIRKHAKKTGKSVNKVTAERLIAGERALEIEALRARGE